MPENQIPQNDEPNHDRANHPLDYIEVNELLPIFVLGALEPDEILAVDSYLQDHKTLLKRLASLEATAAQLAYAAPPTPLPSPVKANLMERARADLAAQQAPSRAFAAPVFPPRRKPFAPQPLRTLAPSPRQQRPTSRPWFSALTRAVIGVGVAALVLFAISVSQLWSTTNRLTQQLAAAQQQIALLQTQNTHLQTTNQSLQQQLQNQHTQIVQLTNEFDLVANAQRTIKLTGTKEAPTAQGAFFVDKNNNGILVVRNLQTLPTHQTYEFWLLPTQGAPVPAGLLQVKGAESSRLTIAIPAEHRDFANVGVSIEPAKGSQAPTGPIVLLGTTPS